MFIDDEYLKNGANGLQELRLDRDHGNPQGQHHPESILLTQVFSEPFGNPPFPANNCIGNIFSGTSNLVSLTSERTSPLRNLSNYDALVKDAAPLLLMAFTRDGLN